MLIPFLNLQEEGNMNLLPIITSYVVGFVSGLVIMALCAVSGHAGETEES